MAGPWVSEAAIRSAIADSLHKDPDATPEDGGLETVWDGVITRSRASGYRDLHTRLARRGYSEAQLDAWDDRESYNLDQALFWAFVHGGVAQDVQDRDYNKFDHRKELDDAAFTILVGGVPVMPGAAGNPGTGIASGGIINPQADVSYDTFRTQRDRRRNREFGISEDDWYGN